MSTRHMSHPNGMGQAARSHISVGIVCISAQIGILVCALIDGGNYYFLAEAATYNPFISMRYIYNYSTARNMALSSTGLMAGFCYIALGVLGTRLSQSMRTAGAPPGGISHQKRLLNNFKALSILGMLLSILLLSFSIYLAYIMSIYWTVYVSSPYAGSGNPNALSPMMLHIIHAILAFVQIFNCVRGTRVVLCVPQVTASVAYQVQVPAQSAYVVQQQAYPQPYPAGQQQYSVPYPAGQQQYPVPYPTEQDSGKR